uniref:Uncharacterized protein n=1 Tax=Oryza sativa subsp. japonica TaxID=39947 RepID=Q6YUP6_ORYSJ|nr:hypothetical protein [Oryza sativa Japonica Group]
MCERANSAGKQLAVGQLVIVPLRGLHTETGPSLVATDPRLVRGSASGLGAWDMRARPSESEAASANRPKRDPFNFCVLCRRRAFASPPRRRKGGEGTVERATGGEGTGDGEIRRCGRAALASGRSWLGT